VLLTVTNLLPQRHILPVDPTVMAGPNGLMVGDLPTNRTATHLHGRVDSLVQRRNAFPVVHAQPESMARVS